MATYRTIHPGELRPADWHQFIVGAVAPRPVAFASTISAAGEVNLSPFSFFNAFSSNPAILIFSPANRVRDNTQKHTLDNVRAVPECVINLCDYAMAEQMSLASVEYPRGVNEFVKAGFTELASEKVRPPRVAEAPAQFECRVNDVISLGTAGGAGNLVICEVVAAHFRTDIINFNGVGIDPRRLDAIARLGGDWYARITPESLFEIPKPVRTIGIGVDELPAPVRESRILTGNNLGRLGNVEHHSLPTAEEIAAFREQEPRVASALRGGDVADLHRLAQEFLEAGDVAAAWKVLLSGGLTPGPSPKGARVYTQVRPRG